MTAVPTFAATLARLRTARRLNHNQLADACGLDHSYISRLERGKREPSRETVMVLARALGLGDGDRGALLRSAGYWPDCPHAAFSIAFGEAFPDGVTFEIDPSERQSVTLGTMLLGGPS